jgi:hypothetical protein
MFYSVIYVLQNKTYVYQVGHNNLIYRTERCITATLNYAYICKTGEGHTKSRTDLQAGSLLQYEFHRFARYATVALTCINLQVSSPSY